MGSNPKELLNSSLPQEIMEGGIPSSENTQFYLQQMLAQQLPSSDTNSIKSELKWQFLLDQHSIVRKRKRKLKKTFLTRKQRKEMDLLKLPKEGWDYTSLKQITNMWKEYMRENLDLVNKAPTCLDKEWNTFSVIVAKSEMVGAELKVVKSKVPSLVGLSGIVVLETKMTFQIVTPQSKLKTILKDTSMFEFTLDSLKFTFFGKHLATRPSDRSVKKIKNLMHPDL